MSTAALASGCFVCGCYIVAKSFRRSRIGQICAKSTRQLANDLVQRRHVRRETLLEMQALDPHWVFAMYVRSVAIGAAFGWRSVRAV
jgi:hypothetical protein